MSSQTTAPFGAILERVPTAGAQWSTREPALDRRKSPWSSLISVLLVAAVTAGGWYGYQHWYLERAPLPAAAAEYVDGPGVSYTSPVTGIGAEFPGAPVETVLPGGAPASVYVGDDWTVLVGVFPAADAAPELGAALDAYAAGRDVRVGTVSAGGSTYAAAVIGGETRPAEALFGRLADSLRLPGGASISAK